MIKVTTRRHHSSCPDGEKEMNGDDAQSLLMRELSKYTVLRCDFGGTPWYVQEMSERDGYFVLVSRLEDQGNFMMPYTEMRFQRINTPDDFDTLFMLVFFYAAATYACTPEVREYMTTSCRITGLAPFGPGRIKTSDAHWAV